MGYIVVLGPVCHCHNGRLVSPPPFSRCPRAPPSLRTAVLLLLPGTPIHGALPHPLCVCAVPLTLFLNIHASS